MSNRLELYKAVKYEVENFFGDHGADLVQMWGWVKGRDGVNSNFWREICLADYREERRS